MADDKKNKEALDALHNLQNAHAATSSVSKTDWSKATDASSFTKTANAAADGVRKEYTKNVDSNYINSFLKDSRLHLNSATSDNVRMGVATSKSIYESRMKTYGDLNKRSYEISRYLEDNKDNIDEETYKSLKDYLNAFDKASSQSIHSFYRNQKFYSQFKTQEEYDKYVTEKEAYEAKVNLDLDAAAKEIDDLKAKRYDYANNHQFDLSDYDQRETYDKAIAEMGKQIAQKEQYLNQARHIQEGVKLSSVADPFSKSYDRNFRDLSQYTSTFDDSAWSKLTSTYGMGYKDLTYEYINNQDGIRDEIKEKHIANSLNAYGNGESIFEQNGYDYLTKDEVDIYNYYYAMEGTEKAEEYLDSIQETLNYRKATSMYQNMEDKTGLELAFGVAAGLDQFTSGVKNLFNAEDDYIAQTAYQMASGMVREDLADKGAKLPDWMGGASMGQAGYDLITTSANMAPSILASTAANIILPGSGKIVGNTLMGMSAAGNAYQQALNEGYDKSQARAYSTMIGASEAILGELLGGISTLGGTSAAVTNMLNGVDNAFLRFVGKLGGSFISEGFEEGLQEVLSPMFSNFFMRTDEKINWSEVAYSALLGALSAGIMEGPSIISGEVSTYQTGRQLQAADISAQRIADIGKTFSADTVAYQLAGRVDENTGAYTMGRLFNEIGATMTEQNVNDITNALVREGIPEKIAKNKAKLMAKIVEGAELTEEGIRAIESDTLMSRVMKTTFVDSNSTWFQRSNGYKDVLKALAQEKASRTEQAAPGQESQANPDKVDAENKNATEDSSAADIPVAKVSKISTIKDGKVTLTMEDGSEVDITKADLDPEDGVIIETIAKIGGISAADANYIMATLKTTPGISAQVAALGAKEAYQYGFYGMSDAHMGEHGVFVNSLPKAQREAIYKTGRDARARDTAAQQATVSKKESVATSEESSQVDNKLATDAKKVGKVHFDGDRSKLTNRQKASLTAMEKVADIMGVQIHVFESKVGNNGKRIGANGWYDPRDNSIHIDLHSGANGEGTMLFTLSHELTHHIRKWSPEKFKVLSDFLMEEYGNKGVNVDALVRKQQEKAKRGGRTISYDTAWEEVVADSMETMLADGNVLNRLEKLKAKDKDLWYEIKRIINDLADKIKAVYKGMTPDSMEGRIVADMGKAVYRLQELFAEALVDASENYQASLTPGEEGVVANQNGELVAHATEDGTVQLSMRTYEEDGRNELRKYLQKCVSSNKLTKAEMQEMMDGIEEIYRTCKEFKDQYAPFSSWSDAAVVRDTYGKPVFSVVTPNGDYKMNLDFSLVCKKRRTLDAVFNEMSRRGIIDNFELGQKSVVKINEIIRKYGLETACALCFVDAKRFRQASMADQFTNLYNELVLSLVPEDQRSSIEHFNFGGYDTIKKVDGGIHTWNASKLDFSHLDEVMKNYGKGTVEHKAAKYIKSHPEVRKLLLRGDFMSSQGFDAVKTQNKDILKLYNSKKGTGGPKAAFGDVQYMNEIVKKARTWTPAKAYSVGGVRIQSFSDYVPRMVFDYTQMIYDLAATKLPAHAYTKEAMFVKQFGLTGVKINMSLIPAIAEGGIAPGLDANGNYVWAGESFDYETAKEIQNSEGYTENCGTICVGVSKQHIEKLLRDPNIRMVIPYHKSGLNPIVAHMNKIAEFTDYTNDQRTKGKDGKALSKDFDFSKALHDMGDKANPKAVADQYLKWCTANGYTAKFAEFAMEENYYKLLEDFTLYDKDGNYVPQREVRAVFPKADSAFGSMKDLIQEGLQEDAIIEGKRDKSLSSIVDEIQETLPRTEAEIEETQVAQADRDLEAEVKYSMRDMDIDRTFIEYGDVASEKAAIDKTVASLIAEGKTIEITAKEVDKHRSSSEWDKKKESRLYLKRILKGFLGKSVYFNHNGIKAEAYLTKEGFNHSSVGLNVPEKATAFSKYRELIANAEYSYSSKNDTHSNANKRIAGKIDWDCFVAAAMIENEPYPVVFKVRTIDSDVRSQIYRMATKNEIGSTHDYGQQDNLPDALPNYGGTPISGDMVSQPASEVKKFSDRDTVPLYSMREKVNTDGMDSEATKIISKLETRARFSHYSKGKYASYSVERIERELDRSSATKMDYAKSYIAWVEPDDFLYATTTSQDGRDRIEEEAGTLELARLREETQPIHLTVDFETGKIVGHEGRHRMTALRNAGVEKVAVIFDAWNDDRYNTKPVSMMRIGGQEFDKYHSGIGFYVHDMLPLSKRYSDAVRKLFSNVDGSIKYSDRDTESVSNRSLLANALESVAKNDIERGKIQEYKEKIGLINAEEKKLQELNLLLKAESNPKRMREIQFDAQQTANRINTYDRQLLRLEASRPLKDVLTREKKMAYDRGVQKGKDAMEAYRVRAEKKQEETRERYKESRQKTEMRHKVQNVVKELNDLLLNENKKRHVPDSLKKAVADALSLVNMDTVGAEERAANYANLIAKEQAKANPDQDKIDAYTVTMENILRQGEKMGQKLKELRDAYEEIQESNDPDIANAYDPVIAGCLKDLSQSIGNTSLRNMTVEQLSDVYDMYRMVLTRVRDANKTLLQNIKESISNLASRVIVEVRVSGGEHKYRASVLDPAKKFLWNNLKPVYAMEHIGSSTLTKVFNNVRAGEDVWARDVTEARAYYLDKSKKYGYDSWDFKKKYRFASDSDLEFELTLEQILSLYAYSKREQALDHLRLGGFVFDSNIETYKNKDGKTGKSILKYKVNTADAHQITPEILANIIGKLSAEQKGFVDEMQDYLSTTMGAKGNEVTMAMYGVKLFKEKFYFPLKSAKQFMFEQNEVSGEVRIKNSGFTNKVVAKANNPVILSNFMDVWTGHVNDMSMYHAFVLPLEDFNRVFNYNTPKMEGQPPVSVKGTIQGAYSPAAVSYVKNLITDLNGGARTDSTTGPINKLMGMFKKGAVFASASVVIQQPSAIARATAIIDTKYFIGPKVDHKKHKALWEEVKQYAPVAIIKEMGYFDTNMGKSTDDFIKGKEYSGIQDKAKALVTDSGYRDEVLSKAPALADEIAWCAIWEAAKRETKAKHPGMDAKSDAFLKLAGERFTEVITKTQVYDSVLSRSANMRSKDTGMKMATAFMAEPTTSINMVADALLKAKRGDKKTCRKAIGSVVASVILNSFLVAWVYAARDDDEDETYREKYLSSFISGIADGVNPMTYIPFLKDIVSIVQGYDVERSDMAVISDLWSAWKQLKNDDVSAWRKVEGFVGSICQIFGLPVKNIMRDVRSVFQAYDTIVHGEKNTTRGTAIAIVEGITGKKPSNPEQLYAARKRGDEEHAARVEGRYDDEKSADAAVRKAITDRYMDDKLTLAQATMQLTQYAGMKPDEAYWLMRGWKHKKETGSDDYGKYNDFYEAVQTGKDLKAVIKEYTDNGVKISTLSGQITSHFKDEYVQMSAGERANIKGYLINAFEQCGVSRKNAEERLREWDFEAKHGASYEEIVADYKNGNINETTMRSILAEKGYSKSDIEDKIHDWNVYKIYGHEYSELDDAYRAGELSREEFRQAMIDNGTFPAKADQAIITYDWMRDNAQYGLEYSDAAKYAHPIENYGYSLEDVNLAPDIYLEYKELKKGCQGVDADNDGKADDGTLRASIFEMIDSLPITNDQKDALAAISYSMKSIKRYAPWH